MQPVAKLRQLRRQTRRRIVAVMQMNLDLTPPGMTCLRQRGQTLPIRILRRIKKGVSRHPPIRIPKSRH